MNRAWIALPVALIVGACASVNKPAELTQAEQVYQELAAGAAAQRVEADLLRARQAIDTAQLAVAEKFNQTYVDAAAHIALRRAQIAQANYERITAREAADSLNTARLERLVATGQQQRDSLARAQQASQEEISALRQRTDSLRRVAEEANARLNDALGQLRTLVAEITNIRETTRGLVISLSDILFDVNRATLKAGAEANVQRIAGVLQQYPDYNISVEGHTDATGSDSYNQDLSQRRAASVRQALIAGGVPEARITSKGLGESQPVATNDTPAGRQQNRRVEVIVLGAGSVANPEGTAVPDSVPR